MVPKPISKYAIRMMKLSGRIFGEYKRPPIPREITRAVMLDNKQRSKWESYHYQNESTINKSAMLPPDLDVMRTPNYYPAHPQLKDLMTSLREYGLYR